VTLSPANQTVLKTRRHYSCALETDVHLEDEDENRETVAFRFTECGMNFLIEIPEKYYNQLIAACDRDSPEYELLKNGCIAVQRYAKSARRKIQVVCDEKQLAMLRETAIKVCPEATRFALRRKSATKNLHKRK
jgi:hypothetical protein